MTQKLNEKQKRILDFIRHHHEKTGVFPSVREIAAHMDFRSTNTVDYYVRQLEAAGHLERGTRRARTFSLATGLPRQRTAVVRDIHTPEEGIPLVGRVAAGEPILAEQNFDGMVNMKTLFRAGSETFALRVKGDSMIDAGIVDGDLVIVRQQGRVENGQIGVAVVNDEATVKRIYDDGKRWRLEPENSRLKPILVEKGSRDFHVAGKVVGVIRQI
ncbi:MAG: transcriptional repressor LexA [Candidatus Sumerlaeaceae bacterium]|nr:transcriptional repressor LexA [Candidatus Sumerlaeaceae bacterium]